jgi:hypothetical protein
MVWPLIALLLAMPDGVDAPPRKKGEVPKLAITGVTVIDGTAGPVQPNMTVVIVGDRITALGPTGRVAVPEGAEVVKAANKYLIPGLWDMHAHVESEAFLGLFVGNGVTGVRHMYTASPLNPPVRRWQSEIAAGKRLGPRIVATTRVLDGPRPIVPTSAIPVATARQAREAVDRLREEGEEFIKVYPLLPREAYFAILEEANQGLKKLPVAGHVPHLVTAAEASDRGQKCFEHCYGILLSCSKNEEQLRQELATAIRNETLLKDNLDASGAWRAQVKALETYDPAKAAALFKKFVANGTWQAPTLVCRRTWAMLNDASYTDDPRRKYLPLFITATWGRETRDGTVIIRALGITLEPKDIEYQKLLFEGHLKLVRDMHKAGVKLLAGTDTPVPYCFPGSGVHDELELFVQAGLTPREALQTATRNPAEYLGRLADLGTVEVGKLADLVLLDANPLDDIRNIRKIHAVVVGGNFLPKATVQRLAEGRKP